LIRGESGHGCCCLLAYLSQLRMRSVVTFFPESIDIFESALMSQTF
jgi:hypothetical protein